MAKHRRKPSSAQRDKSNILVAKHLKESGILSKQVKLHGGKFISKEVLAKVRKYQDIAALNYGAVKVTKDVAKAAKERGYTVVQGNKIVGPKTPTFRNRLKSGTVTGVKPVKGGYMEEVQLPHTVYDLRSLVEQLKEGIDTLKLPEEHFAFKYKGSESYRGFRDTQDMLDKLLTYKAFSDLSSSKKPEDLQEEFGNFTIYRLHPKATSINIRSPEQRKRDRAKAKAEAIARGEFVTRKKRYKTRAERFSNMSDWKVKKILEQSAAANERKMEKLRANPVKYQEYLDKGKARAKHSRELRKGTK